MLIKLLKTERMKLKGSPVWLAFLIMPIIPAILGTINYVANIDILTSEWDSLWTQHTLFTDYFFLPIMIGVYCAYIMRIEHNNHNWNKMLTMPINRGIIFVSKLITTSFMIFISEIWIGVLFAISGKISGITSPFPIKSILVWCLLGTLGGMVMASIQMLLSLYIKSFALPVGIAFGGGLSGLVFLAKKLGHIWPYSLMAYGMNSNAPQKIIESGYGGFFVTCVAYIALFSFMGSWVLNRCDV
jgi:ABC-2 type transport system permease protein